MKKVILLLVSVIFISSCTEKVYFSKQIKEELESVGVSPTKLQFYLDKKITLKKVDNSINQEINEGNITISRKVVRNLVVFGSDRAKAMAICKAYTDNQLDIYVEKGESEKKIKFELAKDGLYALQNSRKIEYDGATYDIIEGLNTRLQIKKSDFTKYKTITRKSKGIKISD